MQVDIKLKSWKIRLEKQNNTPIIEGEYGVFAMGSEIAKQGFNGEYGGKKIAFSGDLIQKISAIESEVIKEIQALLT